MHATKENLGTLGTVVGAEKKTQRGSSASSASSSTSTSSSLRSVALKRPTTSASLLDSVIPTPRLLEFNHVDLAVQPDQAWEIVRHLDLGCVPIVRALFALRTIPSVLVGKKKKTRENVNLRIDDIHSSPEAPGFRILAERGERSPIWGNDEEDGDEVEPPPPHEFEIVVGAIGKVWHLEIPFVHMASRADYAAFDKPDYIKVAWALRVTPLGDADSRVTFELRVDATDEEAWSKFRRYFRLIGPGSHLIRHAVLAHLAREHGTPESRKEQRPLFGDELIHDGAVSEQVTHEVTIAASPEAIWPWLVQMGCRRGGFYSYDLLDNGAVRSAREIHPELQSVFIGDIIPATPTGTDGFEVLRIDPNRALVLGGLYDVEAKKQLRFFNSSDDDRGRKRVPKRYWQATWAFVMERLDEQTTRLIVRARVAFPPSERLHAAWIGLVHHFMERRQLERLAALVEGRTHRDDWRDIVEGATGAAAMAAAFLTPFLRDARSQWGLDDSFVVRKLPGDDLIPEPRWGWTHGIAIDASAEDVWPWVAQIGADRGGFYSYQWLENVAGCNLRNAETIHPEWEVKPNKPGQQQQQVLPPPEDAASAYRRGRSEARDRRSRGGG